MGRNAGDQAGHEPRGRAAAPPPDDLSQEPPRLSALSRRTFLSLGAGTVGLAAMGVSTANAAPLPTHGGRPTAGKGLAGALAFLDVASNAYPAANTGPRLAQSYADELGLFSTAFVYDNALAICAYLAAGRQYRTAARTLGDGLVYALEHDPVYSDGRLRQAYNVGPYVFYDGNPQPYGFVQPDGTANIGWQFGFLGTAVGDMAWPGIALVQLHEVTRDPRYLAAAVRIGEWITTNTWSTRPLGGFSLGVDGANVSLPNGSTEHNIDCVSFFSLLRHATRDSRWDLAAAHARAFVLGMWNDVEGYFYTGTNDGVSINPSPIPLDPQTWSWLALQARDYADALDWATEGLAVTDSSAAANTQVPPGVTVSGVTFSSASLTSVASYNGLPVNQQGVWLEGTAQLATALADRDRHGGGNGHRRRHGGGPRRGGNKEVRALLDQIKRAQGALGAGQLMGGVALPERSGVVAASSLIDSGFGFGYFQVQHVGATSWYVMAEKQVNPFQRGGL